VRSLFFRYGLYFPDSNTKAVMYTDSTGEYCCIVCEQCCSKNDCGTLGFDAVLSCRRVPTAWRNVLTERFFSTNLPLSYTVK
jgi:hypothetical protein